MFVLFIYTCSSFNKVTFFEHFVQVTPSATSIVLKPLTDLLGLTMDDRFLDSHKRAMNEKDVSYRVDDDAISVKPYRNFKGRVIGSIGALIRVGAQ